MSGSAGNLLKAAKILRDRVGNVVHDQAVEAIFADAEAMAGRAVSTTANAADFRFDRMLDRIITSKLWGFPLMVLLLTVVFWLTIAGANVPSAMLAELTMTTIYGWLHSFAQLLGAPLWLSGFLIDGVYLGMAWVFSVMLPPMAIFFPLFTLLEDFGYLPRVAFNMDRLFRAAGAHGKQALTMTMGFGCNAAGVVATRIIDSPRERLIAIITNNFSICNGRWPTLILMGTIFVAALAPPALSSLVAAGSVVAVAVLGIVFTLLVSAFLSRTWLKGEASTFSLELPPYRPPQILQTLYTSLIDRTVIVLTRALVMAAPAGGVIWLLSNVYIGDASIAAIVVDSLNGPGWFLGLNGIILLAYIVAIPANEIIVPTIIMLTLTLGGSDMAQAGVMIEFDGDAVMGNILTDMGGWTLLTGVNLMLFSLLHNPCSTTIMTIWNETRSVKWTVVASLLPLALGFVVCFTTATVVRALG